jgi:cobalt-zinc-cadmium efflux system outer membrane protein
MHNNINKQEFRMCRYEHLLTIVVSCLIVVSFAVTTFAQSITTDVESPEKVLTLKDAIGRVHDSPNLKAAAKGVEIQEGLSEQAGLLPNPDVAVEVENFGGEDELEDFDGAETTVALSQLIELGGKRGTRIDIANHNKTLAEWDFQIQTQDLQLETMKAFYAVLAAQKGLKQESRLLALAEQGYQTVADRVDAGKVSPVQKLRASVELNMARNAYENSQRELAQVRQTLSSLWGDPKPDFGVVQGEFDVLQEPPIWEDLQAAFPDNPDVKRWETELASKNANLDMEGANSIPDITLAFGVRNYQETNDNAFVAGLEFPLPLFDRNQGGRRAAQAEVSQAIYQRDAEVTKLASNLQTAYQELLSAHHQARTVKQEIMPAAEQANEAAQIGYQEGKFNFLEALDAQRTLFEVKAQYIEAFSAYHEARLNVMRMTGRIDRFSTF